MTLALLLVMSLAAPCESLLSLKLPETTILSASVVAEGPFTPPSAGATAKPIAMVAACRVAGRVTPEITFEVWMPVAGWNGKFQGVGGGGFAGSISYGAMATALRRGYATASTDTGHSTPGGSWALNRPDLIADFGHRAIHEMTVKAKDDRRGVLRQRALAIVLRRLLDGRTPGTDGGAALPERLRRHRRRRARQLLDAHAGRQLVHGVGNLER